MNRFICIHGHFYQPPRENPWLEEVEMEDSAAPYHDWNRRITAECYAPNMASRILDPERRIIDIVNNYSQISFNFGPTLLSWLERKASDVYRAILEADRLSMERFSGHGSAIAQAYNHMIMPLASRQDKRTQVVWGLMNFEYHFKRKAEGMWLPETAVDLETLEILAESGIKFTILAPHQALRISKIGGKRWKDVTGERIDSRMAYLCRLPSGRSINIFFYNAPISRDIAFSGLLASGENLANRLLDAFMEKDVSPQVVNVATDGETYGHHHRFGDMALAYCLYHIESKGLAKITVYGEYLEKNPPTFEVEIIENSSWSCVHGLERWKSNCGCSSGRNPGWHQEWRAPLREAMDWLRDRLFGIYEEEMAGYLKDPSAARDDYISVILERSDKSLADFFSQHAVRELHKAEKVKVRRMMEMQRNAMLMYTSCGWFFDDISGLETVQIILYAARALQLAREVNGLDLEPEYLGLLERAASNVTKIGNAKMLYLKLIKPKILDLLRVGAHYALSSLFAESQEDVRMFCYTARNEFYDRFEHGKQKLVVGKTRLISGLTGEELLISFVVVHFGNQNIIGGVRQYNEDNDFETMREEVKGSFQKGNITQLLFLIDSFFGDRRYSLWHLFRDEQRRIVSLLVAPSLEVLEINLRQMFKEHYQLMRVMIDLNIPLPYAYRSMAEVFFNQELRQLLEREDPDLNHLKEVAEEIRDWPVALDRNTLGYTATLTLNRLMKSCSAAPSDIALIEKIESALKILNAPPMQLELNLWNVQNLYFDIEKDIFEAMDRRAESGDETAKRWLELFKNLGESIKIRTP